MDMNIDNLHWDLDLFFLHDFLLNISIDLGFNCLRMQFQLFRLNIFLSWIVSVICLPALKCHCIGYGLFCHFLKI